MVRLGVFLAVIGFGSSVLHFTDVQFRVLAWAEQWQPGLGIGVGAAGVLICVLSLALRRKPAAAPPAYPAPQQYAQPTQQFPQPPREPFRQAPAPYPPQQPRQGPVPQFPPRPVYPPPAAPAQFGPQQGGQFRPGAR